jgi:hypothetical protein
MRSKLRQKAGQRLEGLRNDRESWRTHWAELAENILPRRYDWLVSANRMNRGSPINHRILDSTGTIAARVLAAGLMSGITSPTRPWFKLRLPAADSSGTTPVSLWLAEVESRMTRVFAESNFYTAMATAYLDLAIFGSACMIGYEDYDDVVRWYNPCLGEYFFGCSYTQRVDTIGREYVQNVAQLVARWGEADVSDEVRTLYRAGGTNLGQEFVVRHLIEPNVGDGALAPKFKWREIYWLEVGRDDEVLSVSGFSEWPGMTPRWDISSNDAYGRSPAMDALGDIKQLQQETKRKAQAIDKMVNPPMLADLQLKNQPASLLPGGVTYVANIANTVGFKPVYQVMPPVAEIKEDIAEVQQRIKAIFFNPLFTQISDQSTGAVRTATEISALREEKLIQLGPVLERFENEALDPAIDRTFAIMHRAGLLPPPPPEIAGQSLQIQYVSMLAEAQRGIATGSIERLLSLAGNLAAVDPSVLDNIDLDEAINEYSELLANSPKLMRAPKDVQARRTERAQQQKQQALAEQTPAAVQGAQTLSQTRLGNGQSALDAILGNA